MYLRPMTFSRAINYAASNRFITDVVINRSIVASMSRVSEKKKGCGMASNQKIFRKKALMHYQQNRVPKILPRFASPLTISLYWLAFPIFIGIAIAIWSYNVPQFTQGPGVVQNLTANALRSYGITGDGQSAQSTQTTAIIFFSSQFKTQIRAGATAQLQIKGEQQAVTGTIKRVDEIALSPDGVRQRYHLDSQTLANIPQPAIVALIVLSPTTAHLKYDGMLATAQVQVATQNVLALFFQTLITSGIL